MRSFALLGSGEFEPWSEPVDRWMLSRVARPEGTVIVLPTASAPEGDPVFDRWAEMGLRHFQRLEVPAEVLPLKTREDAGRPEFVAALDRAAYVYFSGGNPAYLADVLRDTPFWAEVRTRIEAGLGYAGCSAGIACLGDVAPDSARQNFDDEVWQPGLGLFPHVQFGPHWDMLDAFVPGLRGVIESNLRPGDVLFAVDERTAAVGDGAAWSVVGLGSVHVRQAGSWKEWGDGERFAVDIGP